MSGSKFTTAMGGVVCDGVIDGVEVIVAVCDGEADGDAVMVALQLDVEVPLLVTLLLLLLDGVCVGDKVDVGVLVGEGVVVTLGVGVGQGTVIASFSSALRRTTT